MKLTVNEIAQRLDLPASTVERWIRQGRIPIRRSGDICTFSPSVLEEWALAHTLCFSSSEICEFHKQNDRQETLLSAMMRGGVLYSVKGCDAGSVLNSAVKDIPFLSAEAKSELYEGLIARECLTSTGIGKGIAVPHPRYPLSLGEQCPAIITCFLETPADFKAIDGKPVSVMFILLSTSTKIHLHLLSRLSFCLRDDAFVSFLKTAPETDSFFLKISEFEKELGKTVS
ncbi:MAG: hypothetical protein BWK80_17150 [Desulfobacteraceae bacterium IS3]|nr:MAG: hypothetical protein BWK80_17150 [Desulfobacteraceae bacterium IS3]